jgi:hypothetical protein
VSLTQQDSHATAIPADAVTDAPTASSRPLGPGRSRWRRTDALVLALSALLALWITSGIWAYGVNHRVLRINASDQAFFEWLLSYSAHAVTHGHNPLWTTLLNSPGGVNLAVNTAVTVLGVALTPLTLTLGPTISFAFALTLAIAATPVAWYLLLSRVVVRGRLAAVVGGLFCGFAPGAVSHANGHLNFASAYLVPLIVWRVLALRRPGHAVRDGLVLGVLIAVQYSLGGETLFFTALGCGVFLGCWVLAGRREPRGNLIAFGKGMLAAVVVAAVLLAYPLWMQFMGPASFHGTGFDQVGYSEDLLAYGSFPRRSLAGEAGLYNGLAFNRTEENSFFGVPALLLLAGAAVLAQRYGSPARRRLAKAVTWSAVIFAVLSLGPQLRLADWRTHVPLPYWLLRHVPLFDSALPGRYALVVAVFGGVLLALGIEAAQLPEARIPLGRLASWRPLRTRRRVLVAGLAVGLVPLVPVPLLAMDRSPVPDFITSGTWRQYVDPGETIIPVPIPSDLLPDGQRWQAAVLAAGNESFRIPAGFFLGPGGPDGRGRIGPPPRPTVKPLDLLARQGRYPAIATDRFKEMFLADVRYWQGDVVVLPDGGTGNRWTKHHDELLNLFTVMLGPGDRVDDVYLWRV